MEATRSVEQFLLASGNKEKTMLWIRSRLICLLFFPPLAACLSACAGSTTDHNFYSRGFDTELSKYKIVCNGREIDQQGLLHKMHPKLVEYVNDQEYTYDLNDLDFNHPLVVSYKFYKDKQYLRYIIEEKPEDGEFSVDGGVVVVFEVCSESIVFFGMLVP